MLSFLPFLVILTGAYSLFHYRSILLSPRKLLSPLIKAEAPERRKTRSTLLLALSGTLGVGNITGVATALILGGEGSVFWMFLSSIFSLALKYAEATLAARYGRGGGMSGVLKVVLPRPIGSWLALLYAIAFLFLSLILGAGVQSNAIIENAAPHFAVKKEYLSLLLALLLAFFLLGNTARILRTLSFTLPLATVVYVVLCLGVVFKNLPLIPPLLFRILKSAFQGLRPAVGGVAGTLTKYAIKEGFFAGLLSNEAGAGTSALAHTEGMEAEQSGIIGILEVLFDTTLLCTLSAMTFLLMDATAGAKNAGEVIYKTFLPLYGEGYIYPLLFSVILLAVSSSLCYFIYAGRTLAFLGCGRWKPLYTLLFLSAAVFGGVSESTPQVVLSHAILAVLTTLTTIAIFASARKEKQKTSDTESREVTSENRLFSK